jgi:hypothetical protein
MGRTRRRDKERPPVPNRLLSFGFACLLAAGLTACGSSSEPEPRVASVPKTSTASSAATPSTTPTAKAISQEEWSRRLDDCMSSELPDLVGPDGKVSRRDKTDPEFQAAVKKCVSKLPPAEEPEPEPLSPEMLAKQRDYAECMRDNGIAGFPDPEPTPKEPGPNDPQPPYGATNAEWERAFNKCYGIIDDRFTPGVGQG